jgi:large subunit ribosomal protein L23
MSKAGTQEKNQAGKQAAKQQPKQPVSFRPESTHPVVLYPLATEKTIRLMESENKLVFIVGEKSTKSEIKSAIEREFSTKVAGVTTHIDATGRKRAYVRFAADSPAIDVATKLGLM